MEIPNDFDKSDGEGDLVSSPVVIQSVSHASIRPLCSLTSPSPSQPISSPILELSSRRIVENSSARHRLLPNHNLAVHPESLNPYEPYYQLGINYAPSSDNSVYYAFNTIM